MTTPETRIHTDEATDTDSLGRDKYAEALADIAATCDSPLVIGLYGTWGMGKTSLMKLIEKKLDTKKNKTVWFDPWQHQFDENLALSLLHTVVDTFNMGGEGKKILTVIAGAFGSMLLRATTALSMKDIDELGKRFEEERFQVRDASIRLREHFQNLIKKAQGNSKKRLVFFIDDLDRCMPDRVLSLLESLKLYLNLPGCVFFLAVDKQALEQSIRYHYKDVELNEADYLDKIVQLPFHVPPIAPESMEKFIAPLLSEDLKGCLGLLTKGLEDNPRQAKRFINTLDLNHRLALPLSIPKYKPAVLALLLLIQYRKIGLYRMIARKPEILSKWKKGDDDAKSLFVDFMGQDERLQEALTLVDVPYGKILKQYIHLTQIARVTEEEVGHVTTIADVLLKQHELWLKSEGKDGKQLNLSGLVLTKAQLMNVQLAKANLKWCDLRGADLRLAYLEKADLEGTVLLGANLEEANLFG
ncbi:MAG: P-loop NTPase fold protein, partial [Nitrospinota bacterium]